VPRLPAWDARYCITSRVRFNVLFLNLIVVQYTVSVRNCREVMYGRGLPLPFCEAALLAYYKIYHF
jgi:hypothetical protein